jgi:deoxyhypusine synthase
LQVNATASISGLLEKLSQVGGQGRALGHALGIWEEMIRDRQETSIVLACSRPLVALGLRELLVYAIEQHYLDTLIMSAEDLFADLYEALGYVHYDRPDAMRVSGDLRQERESERAGRDAVIDYFKGCLGSIKLAEGESCSQLWYRIGDGLGQRAPRKGVLQAAAGRGVAVFAPDLGTSRLGRVMLREQARRRRLGGWDLSWGGEVVELAEKLGKKPYLSVIRVGSGEADRLVEQAVKMGPELGCESPNLSGSLSVGTSLGLQLGERHVAVTAEPELTLPLLVTGLAQRFPHSRSQRM